MGLELQLLQYLACTCKTHKASELETVIEECLHLMRLRAQIPPDQELKIRRFHTDATKSVKADVEKYWRSPTSTMAGSSLTPLRDLGVLLRAPLFEL